MNHNQEAFKESLGALLALAKASNLTVTDEQIRDCFEGWTLEEDQWNLIYSYLELNQVKVRGHEADESLISYLKSGSEESEEPAEEDDLTGEDSKCYQMYLEEIARIEPLSEAEIDSLWSEIEQGSKTARDRMIEGHLQKVVTLAKEYAGKGVLLSDLIQEGNIALFLAMESFDGGDFGVHATREICSALDLVIMEQTGEADTGNYLAAQANAMMNATEELVEELGREATLEEIAAKMNMNEEMAREIMKISMDALTVNEANGGGETFGDHDHDHDHDHMHEHHDHDHHDHDHHH